MARTRKKRNKTLNKKTHIYCEGFTEKHYFNMIKNKHRKANLTIELDALGKGHKALVDKAISKEKTNKSDTVVVVFDYDNNPTEDIVRALKLAKDHGYYVFYNNFSFELWLLLHFQQVSPSTPIESGQLNQKLARYCNVDEWSEYKNVKFKEVEDNFKYNLEDAITNANKLNYADVSKSLEPHLITLNPYTNIHHDIKTIFNITGDL